MIAHFDRSWLTVNKYLYTISYPIAKQLENGRITDRDRQIVAGNMSCSSLTQPSNTVQ